MLLKKEFGQFEPVMTYVIINMTYVIFIYVSTLFKSNVNRI
jgi:hypothetical protein